MTHIPLRQTLMIPSVAAPEFVKSNNSAIPYTSFLNFTKLNT